MLMKNSKIALFMAHKDYLFVYLDVMNKQQKLTLATRKMKGRGEKSDE